MPTDTEKQLPIKAIIFDIKDSLEHFIKIQEGFDFIYKCKEQGILLCIASAGDTKYITWHTNRFKNNPFLETISTVKKFVHPYNKRTSIEADTGAFSFLMNQINTEDETITPAEVLVVSYYPEVNSMWARTNGAKFFHLKKDFAYCEEIRTIEHRLEFGRYSCSTAGEELNKTRNNLFLRHILRLKDFLNIE